MRLKRARQYCFSGADEQVLEVVARLKRLYAKIAERLPNFCDGNKVLESHFYLALFKDALSGRKTEAECADAAAVLASVLEARKRHVEALPSVFRVLFSLYLTLYVNGQRDWSGAFLVKMNAKFRVYHRERSLQSEWKLMEESRVRFEQRASHSRSS